MIKTILIVLCTLICSTQALPIIYENPNLEQIEITKRRDPQMNCVKDTLIQAANRYITFLNDLGMSEKLADPQEIVSLCAKDCKKIRNGKLLFEGCEHFADQLNKGKEWLGVWAINVLDLIVSTENQTVVIRYALSTQKEDDLIVLVILRYDSNHLIYEINEVHNKLENE